MPLLVRQVCCEVEHHSSTNVQYNSCWLHKRLVASPGNKYLSWDLLVG